MELIIDSEDWASADYLRHPLPARDWDALAAHCAETVMIFAEELGNPRLSSSILFADDETVRQLNRTWRMIDKPTNVLSFPMLSREELLELGADGPPVMLGDVALGAQTCEREAREKGIALADHAAHLLIHGLLHLAGYEHMLDPRDAEIMEAIEIKTLAKMGIADPYETHK